MFVRNAWYIAAWADELAEVADQVLGLQDPTRVS